MEATKESVMASSYRDTLDSSDRVQYDAKLSLTGNRNPYAFSNSQTGLTMCHFCRRPRTYRHHELPRVFAESIYDGGFTSVQRTRRIQPVCLRMGQGETGVPERRLRLL